MNLVEFMPIFFMLRSLAKALAPRCTGWPASIPQVEDSVR